MISENALDFKKKIINPLARSLLYKALRAENERLAREARAEARAEAERAASLRADEERLAREAAEAEAERRWIVIWHWRKFMYYIAVLHQLLILV